MWIYFSPVQAPSGFLPRQAFLKASLLMNKTVSENNSNRTLMIPKASLKHKAKLLTPKGLESS